ncbi:MAG: glycosyltransferase family 9 protein [Rhodospirillales bacterium]|nr:glycosyltransferase family 9 protein [Rhodospirillales bacterium]
MQTVQDLKDPSHRRETPGHRFVTSTFWRSFPAGMRRRWWLFRPFDFFVRRFPTFRRRRGVLVIRMDGIGDMVLFRNTLDHYAEIFGVDNSEITVLGCTSWGSITDEVFKGYRVRVIDEHAYARWPHYRLWISLMVRLLAPAVTVCDSYMRRALMADSLAYMAGAPKTIVSLPYINEPTRTEFTYYISQTDRIINTGVYPTHEIVRHYRFISALAGRSIEPEPPRISWRDKEPPIETGKPYVILNPGSNEPGRRWPLNDYFQIADRLLEKGYRVVLVGSMEEKSSAAIIDAYASKPDVIDMIGRTSLPELLDLMKHAACVLSNDTGPAHLSIALGAPTVVVVGGGHFGSFVPYPPEVTPDNARFVFRKMECYHCFWRCPKRASKFDVFPCIDAVGIEEVWEEIQNLMNIK